VYGAAKSDAGRVGNPTHNRIASHIKLRLGLRVSLVEGEGGEDECLATQAPDRMSRRITFRSFLAD
jgi:hypothetical protein